jgi:hypothetical protein
VLTHRKNLGDVSISPSCEVVVLYLCLELCVEKRCELANWLVVDAILDGSGLAVHYSFDAQKAGIENTDLLDRWRAYAEENVCKR